MKKLILILPLIALLLLPIPALAVEPPNTLEIPSAKVFRNLAEDGDWCLVFQYNFVTDNYSTTPASDSLIFRLYNAAGVLIDTISPYVFPYFESNGYGNGVSSFYLSASDSPPAWGEAVSVNIYGPSAFFSPAQTLTYTLTANDYTSETTQDGNQDEFYAHILLLADRLASAYQGTGVVLKSTSDSGVVLSTYGELYFRGAIEGIQSLCPALFFIQVYVPEIMELESSYDTSLQDTYTGRLTGTDMEEGFANLGAFIGVSGTFAAGFIMLAMCMGLCVWCIRKQWGVEIGLVGSALIAIGASLIVGDVVFTIVMVLSLVSGILIVNQWLLKRA